MLVWTLLVVVITAGGCSGGEKKPAALESKTRASDYAEFKSRVSALAAASKWQPIDWADFDEAVADSSDLVATIGQVDEELKNIQAATGRETDLPPHLPGLLVACRLIAFANKTQEDKDLIREVALSVLPVPERSKGRRQVSYGRLKDTCKQNGDLACEAAAFRQLQGWLLLQGMKKNMTRPEQNMVNETWSAAIGSDPKMNRNALAVLDLAATEIDSTWTARRSQLLGMMEKVTSGIADAALARRPSLLRPPRTVSEASREKSI